MKTKEEIEFAFYNSGTDKLNHGYAEAYSHIFKSFEPSSILEIGVMWGHSLKAWRELFPKAFIAGIDSTNNNSMLERYNRLKKKLDVDIILDDSTSPSSYEKLPFAFYDIIIDDGSHFEEDQRKTFSLYKEYFNKFYVIEDFISYGNLDDMISFIKEEGFNKIKVYDSLQYHKFPARRNDVFKDNSPDNMLEFVEVDLKIITIEK